MAKAPKCKLCDNAHWSTQPHVQAKPAAKPTVQTPSLAEVQAQKERTFTALVTPTKDRNVTHELEALRTARRKNAERQARYRARNKGAKQGV